MANRNNESSEVKKEEKINNGETQKSESTIGQKALNGTKAVVGFTGNAIQKLSSTALVWIVGGFVAMIVSDFLALGILGTAAVLAGAYLVVEGLKFLFSDQYAMHRETIKQKVSSKTETPQQQAA